MATKKVKIRMVTVNKFAVIGGIGSEQARCYINIDTQKVKKRNEKISIMYNEVTKLWRYLVVFYVKSKAKDQKQLTYFDDVFNDKDKYEPIGDNTNTLNFAYVYSDKNLYK